MITTFEPQWSQFAPLDPSRILAGEPSARIALAQAGSYSYGLWEVTPGHFRAIPSSHDEVLQILEGEGELRVASGAVTTLAPRVIVTIPPGFDGEWIVTRTLRKSFVLIASPDG